MRNKFNALRGKAGSIVRIIRPDVDEIKLSTNQIVYGNTTFQWGWGAEKYKHVETAGDILMFTKPGQYDFLFQFDFESTRSPSGMSSLDFESMQVRFDGNHFTLYTWNQQVYQNGKQTFQFQFPYELWTPTNIKVWLDWGGSQITFSEFDTKLFVTYYGND